MTTAFALEQAPARYRNARIAVVTVGALLVLAQLVAIKRSIDHAGILLAPPVSYETLVPEKTEYQAGEVIRFCTARTAKLRDSHPIIMLTVDSFDNQGTGEVFPGYTLSRVVRQSGRLSFSVTRRIPTDASTGTYILEGWASCQTNPLSEPAPYTSLPFTVHGQPPPDPAKCQLTGTAAVDSVGTP